MKKEFSFFEFVGFIVPGTLAALSIEVFLEIIYQKSFIQFSSVGESIIFIVIAYAIGHIIQAIGDLIEIPFWKLQCGWPGKWALSSKIKLSKKLGLSINEINLLKAKVQQEFHELSNRDYTSNVCKYLISKNISMQRIEIFNANYSMSRGLSVVFLLDLVFAIIFFKVTYCYLFVCLFVLMLYRMFRYGKHYAREVYRFFLAT